MIGTIIIAVLGYGFATICGFIGIFGLCLGMAGKLKAEQGFFGAMFFFAMGIGIAFGTRALAGGW